MRLNTHRGCRQELGPVILTVTTVLLLTAAHKAEVKPKKGSCAKNCTDLLLPDGSLNLVEFLKTFASCGTDAMEAGKLSYSLAEECGIHRKRRKRADPFTTGCGLVCVMRKSGLLTESNKWVKDVSTLKQGVTFFKFPKDDGIAKNIAKEYQLCAKLSPLYKEGNCYSVIPYAICTFYGIRRVCVKAEEKH